jgi:hypothetical protein
MPDSWQDEKILAEPQHSSPLEFEQAIHFKGLNRITKMIERTCEFAASYRRVGWDLPIRHYKCRRWWTILPPERVDMTRFPLGGQPLRAIPASGKTLRLRSIKPVGRMRPVPWRSARTSTRERLCEARETGRW